MTSVLPALVVVSAECVPCQLLHHSSGPPPHFFFTAASRWWVLFRPSQDLDRLHVFDTREKSHMACTTTIAVVQGGGELCCPVAWRAATLFWYQGQGSSGDRGILEPEAPTYRVWSVRKLPPPAKMGPPRSLLPWKRTWNFPFFPWLFVITVIVTSAKQFIARSRRALVRISQTVRLLHGSCCRKRPQTMHMLGQCGGWSGRGHPMLAVHDSAQPTTHPVCSSLLDMFLSISLGMQSIVISDKLHDGWAAEAGRVKSTDYEVPQPAT